MAVHGTGTPLGDPIEVGALAGALAGNSAQPRAITLGSVKASLDAVCGDSYTPAVCSEGPDLGRGAQACYGHTEGAAGLTGMLMAMGAAGNVGAPGILCLRAVNPYVSAAIADWSRTSGTPPFAPRQNAPATSVDGALAGWWCWPKALLQDP